jgi:SAM-dependent methyltransferase
MYKGFPLELIESVTCHRCDGKLTSIIEKQNGDSLSAGELVCATCAVHYPVSNGIVNMLIAQGNIDEVAKQEIRSRDKEAKIYDKAFCTPEGNKMELVSALDHLGPVTGKKVLDLGCGTGRATLPLAATAHSIVAIDYSFDSLVHLAEKCPDDATIGLICADITQTRFHPKYFDCAISAQVLQHLRGIETRQRFYTSVRDALKYGSSFVLVAYHHGMIKRILGNPQEGYHSSKIYYHNFTTRQISEEISPFFEIEELHPIEIRIPFLHRLFKDKVALSRNLEHVPILNQFGEWLLLKALRSKR